MIIVIKFICIFFFFFMFKCFWFNEQDALVRAKNDGIHIAAQAMKITWGNDDRFWKWIDFSKEMLPQVLSTAELG